MPYPLKKYKVSEKLQKPHDKPDWIKATMAEILIPIYDEIGEMIYKVIRNPDDYIKSDQADLKSIGIQAKKYLQKNKGKNIDEKSIMEKILRTSNNHPSDNNLQSIILQKIEARIRGLESGELANSIIKTGSFNKTILKNAITHKNESFDQFSREQIEIEADTYAKNKANAVMYKLLDRLILNNLEASEDEKNQLIKDITQKAKVTFNDAKKEYIYNLTTSMNINTDAMALFTDDSLDNTDKRIFGQEFENIIHADILTRLSFNAIVERSGSGAFKRVQNNMADLLHSLHQVNLLKAKKLGKKRYIDSIKHQTYFLENKQKQLDLAPYLLGRNIGWVTEDESSKKLIYAHAKKYLNTEPQLKQFLEGRTPSQLQSQMNKINKYRAISKLNTKIREFENCLKLQSDKSQIKKYEACLKQLEYEKDILDCTDSDISYRFGDNNEWINISSINTFLELKENQQTDKSVSFKTLKAVKIFDEVDGSNIVSQYKEILKQAVSEVESNSSINTIRIPIEAGDKHFRFIEVSIGKDGKVNIDVNDPFTKNQQGKSQKTSKQYILKKLSKCFKDDPNVEIKWHYNKPYNNFDQQRFYKYCDCSENSMFYVLMEIQHREDMANSIKPSDEAINYVRYNESIEVVKVGVQSALHVHIEKIAKDFVQNLLNNSSYQLDDNIEKVIKDESSKKVFIETIYEQLIALDNNNESTHQLSPCFEDLLSNTKHHQGFMKLLYKSLHKASDIIQEFIQQPTNLTNNQADKIISIIDKMGQCTSLSDFEPLNIELKKLIFDIVQLNNIDAIIKKLVQQNIINQADNNLGPAAQLTNQLLNLSSKFESSLAVESAKKTANLYCDIQRQSPLSQNVMVNTIKNTKYLLKENDIHIPSNPNARDVFLKTFFYLLQTEFSSSPLRTKYNSSDLFDFTNSINGKNIKTLSDFAKTFFDLNSKQSQYSNKLLTKAIEQLSNIELSIINCNSQLQLNSIQNIIDTNYQIIEYFSSESTKYLKQVPNKSTIIQLLSDKAKNYSSNNQSLETDIEKFPLADTEQHKNDEIDYEVNIQSSNSPNFINQQQVIMDNLQALAWAHKTNSTQVKSVIEKRLKDEFQIQSRFISNPNIGFKHYHLNTKEPIEPTEVK